MPLSDTRLILAASLSLLVGSFGYGCGGTENTCGDTQELKRSEQEAQQYASGTWIGTVPQANEDDGLEITLEVEFSENQQVAHRKPQSVGMRLAHLMTDALPVRTARACSRYYHDFEITGSFSSPDDDYEEQALSGRFFGDPYIEEGNGRFTITTENGLDISFECNDNRQCEGEFQTLDNNVYDLEVQKQES